MNKRLQARLKKLEAELPERPLVDSGPVERVARALWHRHKERHDTTPPLDYFRELAARGYERFYGHPYGEREPGDG